MFRTAYERACKFAFPVVQHMVTVEGKCAAGAAAFVVINPDGWIVTAGHVMKEASNAIQSEAAARDWETKRDVIRNDQTISNKEKNRRIAALGQPNKKAVRRAGVFWGFQNVGLVDIAILDEADLAVGRLDGFDRAAVAEYPKFKNPKGADFKVGASLCKLGYPFIEISPTYDEATNTFHTPPDQAVLAFFPIDGIFTRILNVPPPSPPPKFPLMYIETSSPGLRGQSGGPTFDTQGAVWAIQSQTRHLPLGFSPEIKVAGKMEKEHQFLNVGMGIHVETVIGFLDQMGIKYDVA